MTLAKFLLLSMYSHSWPATGRPWTFDWRGMSHKPVNGLGDIMALSVSRSHTTRTLPSASRSGDVWPASGFAAGFAYTAFVSSLEGQCSGIRKVFLVSGGVSFIHWRSSSIALIRSLSSRSIISFCGTCRD